MGRKKIKIARINDDRNRSVTYLKRKAGLMKKAHELAVLTGSEVAVIVFGQNGKLTEFCSGDMDRVLLRYTEHTGPVEHKGPEHYANDGDDGTDDDGGDGDDGDIGDGSGSAGAGNGNRAPARQSPPRGDGGGRNENSSKGSGREGKTNKRKAVSSNRANGGNSMSSDASSKRESPLPSSAPIIKVEGEYDETAMEGVANRGALKAAIIQRSVSRGSAQDYASLAQVPSPDLMSHHRADPLASQYANGAGSMPPAIPHRPYTAGPFVGSSMYASHSAAQYASPPRFAYMSSASTGQSSAMSPPGNSLLRPQGWGESGTPQLTRANSASMVSSHNLSYGELARGSGTSPIETPTKGNNAHTVSPMLSPQAVRNPAENYASLHPSQQQNQSPGGQQSLLPLAHPILRQHPQYETYVNQLRMQQQQMQHPRTGSQSALNAHTAPSSPNFLTLDDAQLVSETMSSLDPSIGRRSASFGYRSGLEDRRVFQQTLGQDALFANPFDVIDSDDKLNAGQVRHHQSTQSLPPKIREYATLGGSGNGMVNSLPFGQTEPPSSLGAGQMQTSNENVISNAAFNDLMGSIFSDIGSSASGSTANGSFHSIDERTKESLKEQEDVIRSMESDGSLTTLVNSQSFDGLIANSRDSSKTDELMTDSAIKKAEDRGPPPSAITTATLDLPQAQEQ